MLQNELMELSAKVENYNKIKTGSNIVPILEFGEGFSIPLKFKARVFMPGVYKGYRFEGSDINRNKDSIFKKHGNVANNELNVDHKNNRKQDSKILDLAGGVIGVEYNENDETLWMECSVTNRTIAEMIYHRTIRYVSLRINPINIDYDTGAEPVVRDFDFEELSLVRTPEYEGATIEYIGD